ncbi:type II toxin-antitoxin system RelE/ParE family toxin [Saccharospirillum salsuginis]|uniref:Plasmid stabilization protein n=1 Tax=Saccharospirillum salsuginis TaxID=418750 RepID=A0A918K4C7_9GAMM|nr:type II toxin-antitoxin system RelE/ParE family toxin [Saccharospirillum salsuginis]GGX48878.1 plasmid stabilization protein [Saccharospirillum salsuginis]
MGYAVKLTADALYDLENLYEYIVSHDSPAKADYVLDQIETVINGLSDSPNRGSIPKELRSVGISDYRELFFKPYRILYRVRADQVFVMLVTDGRRDMQSLLQRRLLRV